MKIKQAEPVLNAGLIEEIETRDVVDQLPPTKEIAEVVESEGAAPYAEEYDTSIKSAAVSSGRFGGGFIE